MSRRVQFVLVSVLFTIVCGTVPAVATECVEVGEVQFKHCV